MKVTVKLLVFFLGATIAITSQSPDIVRYGQDLHMADALLSQGDFNGVIRKLQGWVIKFPERPEARHFLGLAYYRLRNFEAVIKNLSIALELEKQESAAWKQTVEILGAAYYFEGRWQEAESLLRKAVRWKPGDIELSYTLAMTHLNLGHRSQARIMFAKTFQIDPTTPQAFVLTAELMLQENRLKDAETLLLKALGKQADLPDATYKLGIIALRRGDYEQASKLLRKEVTQNPKHAFAWHSLGEALSGLDKQIEAVTALKRAIWLNKRLSGSYTLLAKIYFNQQRLELAEDTIRKAIQIHPRSYEAHFLQSRIYYKTGHIEQAKKQLAIAEGIRQSMEPSEH